MEPKIIRRNDVVAQIEAHLAGQQTAKALAKWAFDRFYAEELENEAYEEGAEEVIADALDALMFGDDATFALSEADLAALLEQLRT